MNPELQQQTDLILKALDQVHNDIGLALLVIGVLLCALILITIFKR